MKSFANRFIITSIIVVSGIFLIIYFSFNLVTGHFINNVSASDLSVNIYNNNATTVGVFTANGWQEATINGAKLNILDLPQAATPRDSLALAILSDTTADNYVIINERGLMLSSRRVVDNHLDTIFYNDVVIDERFFFAAYYRENRSAFPLNEVVSITVDNRHFQVRSVDTTYLDGVVFETPTSPITILFYTEVTEVLNLRNTINQILLITLALAAVLILAVAFNMSLKFNSSLKKLSTYAKELGFGQFQANTPTLKYKEFQTLSGSMSEMANMLANYEVNQKQFFQNASHELRTPLMAIQCYGEGILADVFTPTDAANIINDEVEKMTELVNSILYLSRIDHRAFELTYISCNDFLIDCCEQIQILVDNNDKLLKLNLLETDVLIKADVQLLKRALLNILTNALRYVNQDIIITVEPFLQRNIFANIRQEMVRITFFNDGTQIKKSDLPYIFDRFYKGKDGNTGIGLAITKEIITALNGSVLAKNVEDGVQFIIEIPITTPKATSN